ncbi:hypothetical protein HDU87_004980 [Geranomyces variabilis]|uniref:sn-1-specific diacylglycerol lipase n=1 Tax=Geranomyces variabilis TaxID=109894 RepID=A0AAD5TQA1_9FUNG|nr:hypothetical protein HDU87_004980 [Geranomyces variabilis]
MMDQRPQVVVVFDELESDEGSYSPAAERLPKTKDSFDSASTDHPPPELYPPVTIPNAYEQNQLISALQHPPTSAAVLLETVKCTELALRADKVVASSHHNHRPLLDPRIAALISSVSTACRISLRTASIVVEAVFESLKFSASTSLAITRRALVGAISSARTLHLIAMGKGKTSDSLSFFKVLDQYTSAGVYVIHNVFSLAELLTHTTFHLASSTIRFSLNAAEECVHVLDGLFGETETSKALAAFVGLVKKELKGHEDDLALTTKYGKISALGQVTKALTVPSALDETGTLVGHVQVLDTAEVPTAAKFPESSSDIQIEAPSDFGGIAYQELRALEASMEREGPPISMNRPQLLGAMDRRRMSNPERFTNLATRDLENTDRYTIGPGPEMDLGDSCACGAEPPVQDRYYGTGTRHGSLTPDGRRQRTQHKELPAPRTPPSEVPKHPRQDLFEKISRYVRFASGAYGTNFLKILGLGKARDFLIEHSAEHDHNHQSFAFHTDVPVEHILTSSFRNPNALHPPSLIAPVHYLVVDAKTQAVVVSLRGTLGLSDLITDLTSNYACYTTANGHTGKVHAGMLESAEKVARGPVRDAVTDALRRHPTFSLVLTGHSLGGGVAALLALIWSRKLVDDHLRESFVTRGDEGFPVRPVHCFVYGSPAVMSVDLSHHYKHLITSVIYRHDIVPCLSLGLIRDFRNVAVNLCNEQGMAERVIGKVLGVFKSYPAGAGPPSEPQSASTSPGSSAPPSEDDLYYWALLKTLRADMRAEKLYPPGEVYWLDATTPAIVASSSPAAGHQTEPGKGPRIATALTVHHVDDVERAFSEFTFSRTMFLDHSPHSYERALHALMVAMKTQQWV